MRSKNLLYLTFVLMLLIGLVACGGTTADEPAVEEPAVEEPAERGGGDHRQPPANDYPASG